MNTQTTQEFGPFTPQELERVVDWLKEQNLEFKISKDQKAEDLFKMNDPQNLVDARFRTDIYLAQIFSVSVEAMSAEQEESFKIEFFLSEDVPPRFQNLAQTGATQKSSAGIIPFPTDFTDRERLQSNRRKKMFWAALGAIAMIVPIAYSLYNILKTSGE